MKLRLFCFGSLFGRRFFGRFLSGSFVGGFLFALLHAGALCAAAAGLVFGFGIWWFSYLYVWPVIVVVAMIFRSNDSAVIWAVIAGIYGLCFGPLMYILYFIINGWHMVFAMWVSGIPYDITFCISNFILTLVLYRPLYRVMERYVVRET